MGQPRTNNYAKKTLWVSKKQKNKKKKLLVLLAMVAARKISIDAALVAVFLVYSYFHIKKTIE